MRVRADRRIVEAIRAERDRRHPHSRSGRRPLRRVVRRVRAVTLTPFLLALAAYVVALAVMRPDTAGDEQHYLLASQSIVLDGDVDLSNDYASRSRTLAVANAYPQEPHAFRYASDDLISFHGIGLSIVLAPAFSLGGTTGARLAMVLVAALLADQLFRLLRDLRVARGAYRWSAWAAVVFTVPLLVFSNQVYPEIPGALLSLVALRIVALRRPSRRALLLGSVAAAGLPWLHVRYLSIAALLLVGLVLSACRSNGDTPMDETAHHALRRRVLELGRACLSRRRLVVGFVLAPFSVGVLALATLHEVLYGSPHPGAPYEPLPVGTIGSAGWTFWNDYLLAYFLHPADGLIPYSPVAWLGLAALGLACRRLGAGALAVVVGAGLYVGLVASIGLAGGFTFPGRFLVVVVPLLAVALAAALEGVRLARAAFVPLLLASLAIGLAGLLRHEHLYPQPAADGYPARLIGVRSIQTAFPDARPIGGPDVSLPDWPLGALWAVGTGFIGMLMVEVARSGRAPRPRGEPERRSPGS